MSQCLDDRRRERARVADRHEPWLGHDLREAAGAGRDHGLAERERVEHDAAEPLFTGRHDQHVALPDQRVREVHLAQ